MQKTPRSPALLRTHLGQVGRLADAIDAAEDRDVGDAPRPSLQHVPQNIDAPLRRQQLGAGLLQAGPDRSEDALEGAQVLALEFGGHRIHQVLSHVGRHVLRHQVVAHPLQGRPHLLLRQRFAAGNEAREEAKAKAALLRAVTCGSDSEGMERRLLGTDAVRALGREIKVSSSSFGSLCTILHDCKAIVDVESENA